MTIQALKEIIDLLLGIVTLLAFVFGSGAALFLYFQLAPVLNLRIMPEWVNEAKQYLKVKFEVENKSRVRVHSPKIRVQVVEQRLAQGGALSQWVPFSQEAARANEPVVAWREPELISTTKRVFPGETIAVERLYHFPQDSAIVHIGLQVRIKLGFYGRIVTRKNDDWSQTTTCFVVK